MPAHFAGLLDSSALAPDPVSVAGSTGCSNPLTAAIVFTSAGIGSIPGCPGATAFVCSPGIGEAGAEGIVLGTGAGTTRHRGTRCLKALRYMAPEPAQPASGKHNRSSGDFRIIRSTRAESPAGNPGTNLFEWLRLQGLVRK